MSDTNAPVSRRRFCAGACQAATGATVATLVRPAGPAWVVWTFSIDATNESDSRRRLVFGGAHWSQVGRGRLGIVVTLEPITRTVNAQLLERRLLAQTHVEF